MSYDVKDYIIEGRKRGASVQDLFETLSREKFDNETITSAMTYAKSNNLLTDDSEEEDEETKALSKANADKERLAIESSHRLVDKLNEYKSMIDEEGFASGTLSPEKLGSMESMRGIIVAEIKEAKQLGALDSGLLTFASEIIGKKPEITLNGFGENPDGSKKEVNLNLFGRESKRIAAQVDRLATETQKSIDSRMKSMGDGQEAEGTSLEDAEKRLTSLYNFAQENPDDERSKKIMDAFENDKFDLTTGKIKAEAQELNPVQQMYRDKGLAYVAEGEKEKSFGEMSIVDKVLEGGSDILGIFSDTKQSFDERLDNVGENADLDANAVDRAFMQFGEGMGLIADTVGNAFKGAVKVALSPEDETKLKNALTEGAQMVAQTQTVQGLATKLKELESASPEDAQRIKAALNIADALSLGAGGKAGSEATKIIAKESAKLGIDATKFAGKAAVKAVKAPLNLAKRAKQKILPSSELRIEQLAKRAGKADDGFIASSADDALGSAAAKEKVRAAVETGFEEKDAEFMATLRADDKKVVSEMIDLAEKSSVDKRADRRPIDVVGGNLVNAIKPVQAKQVEFGKVLDETAKSLKGKQIDIQPLRQDIDKSIDDMGISVKDGELDFSRSEFKNNTAIQNTIQKAYNALPGDGDDAYDLHIFKKTIDQDVDFGVAGEGLKGKSKVLLKDMRHKADAVLDGKFKDYDKANLDYANTTDILESTRSLFGKQGFTDEKGAQLMRRIFSNAATRSDMIKLVKNIDDFSGEYGIKQQYNLTDQALMSEILENMYGTQALTGLQGEVTKAVKVRGAINATRHAAGAIKNPLEKSGELLEKGADKLFGTTDDDRKRMMREIMGASDEVPKTSNVTTPRGEDIELELAPDLSDADRAIEKKAYDRVFAEGKDIIDDYIEKNGNVVNTDEFRKYFVKDGYNGANAASVQEPSSGLAKAVFAKTLENDGRFASFYAGGSGSGKTSAIKSLDELSAIRKDSATVLDGNLSSKGSALKKIEQASKKGKIPKIIYVYRDPVDSFVNGVVYRMKNNASEAGRLVPTKITADNHINSWKVSDSLEKMGYDVKTVDNSLGRDKAKVVPIDDLRKKIKFTSVEDLTERFNQEAKKLYDAGELTKDQYEQYIA